MRYVHIYVALAVTAFLHFVKAMAYDATIEAVVHYVTHVADPLVAGMF